MNDNVFLLYILKAFFCLVLLIGSGHSQSEGDVRLVGDTTPPTNEGRVEIFHAGEWGTVCNDHFDTKDAAVVCRQLELSPVGAEVVPEDDTRFGPGTGVIWMDDVACTGTELRLQDCRFSFWNRSDCTHKEDVAVICPTSPAPSTPNTIPATTPPPVQPNPGNCTTPDPSVRLVGPATMPGVGVVQVFNGSQWEGVCDDDWDYNDAKVICRMLCYNPDSALPGSVNFDMSNITQPMTTTGVACTGSETSLSQCPKNPWASKNCEQSEKARVTCVPMDNSAPTRPNPLLECTPDGFIRAGFNTTRDPYLETKHLGLEEANMENCGYTFSNETNLIIMSIPYANCNTKRTYNATHVFYENTIKYLPTSVVNGVSTTNTYIIRVQCHIGRQVVADKPVVPLTELVTQQAPGEFRVNMHFFRNNSFVSAVTTFPLEIPLGEWLSAALELQMVDPNLRLVVYDCYATPTANRSDPIRYPLFTNKCIDDNTVGFFPLNNSWFGWRYQTFKFVQYSEVHIHCDSIVCGTDEDNDECDRSCLPSTSSSGRRKKRSARNHNMITVSSGTFIVYDPTDGPPDIIRPVDEGSMTTGQSSSTPSPTTTGKVDVVHVTSEQPPGGTSKQSPQVHVTSEEPPGGTSKQSPQVPTDSVPTKQPVLEIPELPEGDNRILDGNGSTTYRVSQVIIGLACFVLFLAKLM